MKQSEFSPLDQSWTSFINHTPHLRLNTLDFSDLWDEEDLDLGIADDDLSKINSVSNQNPGQKLDLPSPPPLPPLAPPVLPASPMPPESGCRTLRLHWRELLSLQPLPRVSRFGPQSIWAGLEPVCLDTNRLECLFETKTTTNKALCGLMSGKRQKQPSVSVLGVKRSNIITIALSSLPPPHLLPPAVYSMDSTVLDREDVQRLQSLVPSEEEVNLIKEAKAQAPRSPLAPAEECLLILSNIPYLNPRLQLWAFALDYDVLEREIAEPLFHLKLAMEQLAANQTFRCILATVLAIGNFLNGCKARGFELSYLGKLSQVRDTHSRQPLLHHVCVLLLQLYPQSSDLYSDITAVTRASKCDYSQVQLSLSELEALCKASWEQLRLLETVDARKKGRRTGGGEERRSGGEGSLRQRLPHFLKECEERLKVLRAVHRRVINRFHSFLLYLGYSRSMVRDTHAGVFCKTVSDFALEYRATRHGILQQREREQEREKEREAREERRRDTSTPCGKGQNPQKPCQDSEEQSRLEEVLKTPASSSRFDISLPRRRSKTPNTRGSLQRSLKF